MLTKALLSIALLVSAANCASKGKDPETPTVAPYVVHDPFKSDHLVAGEWQESFLHLLEDDHTAVEGWALFDGGGLAGGGRFGQVMVIGSKRTADVYFVRSGENKPAKHAISNPSKFEESVQNLSTVLVKKNGVEHREALTDHWANGFDMFESEFVHVVKDANAKTLTVKQRVKWRFGLEKCVQHCALAEAFRALVK